MCKQNALLVRAVSCAVTVMLLLCGYEGPCAPVTAPVNGQQQRPRHCEVSAARESFLALPQLEQQLQGPQSSHLWQ